ncbi:hypothetical protein GCM10020000_25350 [Streptomyces olivoverticillatus]
MNGPVIHDATTLPVDDNVNPYAFSVDLKGQWFLQKGKMIAYYGQISFHGIGHGPLDRLIAGSFHSPLHAADWVVAEGQGKMLLADRSFDVNSYDLDNGNLTVRSGNLLAFEPSLSLKQSIIPGFLTLIGTGKFVAASNGPVVFVEPPDPGGPAGAGGVGGLPGALPPLRPPVPARCDGRRTAADGTGRRLRRGAPIRVRRRRDRAPAVLGEADGRDRHGRGPTGRGGRPARGKWRKPVGGPAPAGAARGPPAPLRAVSGTLQSVTSNA